MAKLGFEDFQSWDLDKALFNMDQGVDHASAWFHRIHAATEIKRAQGRKGIERITGP